MRIIEAFLEERIEQSPSLSEKEQKRLDKAIVIVRTGLKMIKKVLKKREPNANTSLWRNGAIVSAAITTPTPIRLDRAARPPAGSGTGHRP